MNKRQKKDLTKSRRFHQQVSKKCRDIAVSVVDTETGGLDPSRQQEVLVKTTANLDVIKSLTLKELEYVINNIIFSTRRLYKYEHPEVKAALHNELAERRLLLEKSNQI